MASKNQWQSRQKAKRLQEEGVWVKVPVEGTEFEICVRSRDSIAYQEILNKHYRPLRARYKENIPPDVAQGMLIRVLAEGVLCGWRSVMGADDNPLPFNVENAVTLLDLYPDLRDAVTALSGEYTTFLRAAEEEQLGN